MFSPTQEEQNYFKTLQQLFFYTHLICLLCAFLFESIRIWVGLQKRSSEALIPLRDRLVF